MRLHRVSYSDIMKAKRMALQWSLRGEEICGLLIKEEASIRLLAVKNSAGPYWGFEMQKQWISHAIRSRGYSLSQICGSYHSHPWSSSEPGSEDIENVIGKKLMLIFAVSYHDYRLWEVKRPSCKASPLIAFKPTLG